MLNVSSGQPKQIIET